MSRGLTYQEKKYLYSKYSKLSKKKIKQIIEELNKQMIITNMKIKKRKKLTKKDKDAKFKQAFKTLKL